MYSGAENTNLEVPSCSRSSCAELDTEGWQEGVSGEVPFYLTANAPKINLHSRHT